jgi:xylan 1,4-beta-xylosidase
MNKLTLKKVNLLVITVLITGISWNSVSGQTKSPDRTKPFTVQISDKPMTFCNPLNLSVGSERARRAGEPVVLLYKNDYYLFITGGRGYWYSPNMRDWTYVDVPSYPRSCPSVLTDGETMYACSMNARDVFSSTDPKKGVWTKIGTLDRDYGDADMFRDDDGRFYMYWGWSQVLPFQVVELDPKNGFKEKGKPVVCFFGNYEEHGFERRRSEDVIFPYFTHRPYFPEESPWIEGPWMIKYNGKYYLEYFAIGLEFLSYSQGVYVSDSPMGPFKYSQHNPLTFKTTGFAPGAGHGSTFYDKNGDLWTICMIPSFYGGRGSSDLSLFPTSVDAEGVMHSNTAFGDYPQYHPGIKKDPINNNFTNWMLLSNKKYAEASSILDGYEVKKAFDENFMTHWSAKTGNSGEYLTVDLGKDCNIYALQVNFDQQDAKVAMGRGFAPAANLSKYQCFTVQVSNDNKNWSMLVDKSNNTIDNRHDYTELPNAVKARYVKLTNVFTPDSGKFAVKDLRIFGNPEAAKITKVDNVTTVRNPEDRRDVTLLWQPVKGADGYVIRYGIEPNKLYNNYMVYDANTITIHSLNKEPEYFFKVEAFSSGTEYYRERTEKTMGRGAEMELAKENKIIERKMIKEGVNEYVFDKILPGQYVFRHTFGPNLWSGNLTKEQLTGPEDKPIITEILSPLGVGLNVLGQMELRVYPGKETGRIVITLNYNKK